MASTRHDKKTRQDTEASTEPYRDDCPYCIKNDATTTREGAWKRHAHYVNLARQDGLDGLKAHLTTYLHRWYPDDPDQARQHVHDTMAYLAQEVGDFSGENTLVDDITTRKLPWWEGRSRRRAAIQATYEKTEEVPSTYRQDSTQQRGVRGTLAPDEEIPTQLSEAATHAAD